MLGIFDSGDILAAMFNFDQAFLLAIYGDFVNVTAGFLTG